MSRGTEKNASERVIGIIRGKILNGEIGSGARVNIDHWARELDCSKTPIREALRNLASEGLLSHKPNTGYFVIELSTKEFFQLYELQELIETYLAIGMLPFLHAIDFDELKQINEEIARLIKTKFDTRTLAKLNNQFHMAIYRHYPNTTILNHLNNIWNQVSLQRHSMFLSNVFMHNVVTEHYQIIKAIQSGNPVQVQESMQQHFRSGKQALLLGFPDSRELEEN